MLLIGGSGQIGRALLDIQDSGIEVVAPPRDEVDLLRPATLQTAFGARPDFVVNAAAFTAVDAAEAQPDHAFAVNRDGAGELARCCARHEVPLVHLSTDYVFDGTKPSAYVEGDAPNPINAYGRSKLEGEAAVRLAQPRHIIMRVSWVYGVHGRNFVKTILDRAATASSLRVVDDQRGCPTAAMDAAAAIRAIIRRLDPRADDLWGTYHYAGSGEASWFDVAKAAIERARPWLGNAPRLSAIATREYGAPAARPANSVLDCRLIEERFGVIRPAWPQSLARVVDALGARRRS